MRLRGTLNNLEDIYAALPVERVVRDGQDLTLFRQDFSRTILSALICLRPGFRHVSQCGIGALDIDWTIECGSTLDTVERSHPARSTQRKMMTMRDHMQQR
jgi:hypothetical protein